MYLGMLILHHRLKSSHLKYLHDRVQRRLGGWKCKLLSRETILILIQAVTSTIPAYAMNTCMLPSKLVERLERTNQNFFWGDNDQRRSMHTISWHQICTIKVKGGLGLKVVNDMDEVLLAKLAWRYISQSHLLWLRC